MKRLICSIFLVLPALVLCACITEFETKDIDEVEGILVVEGIITDDESVITLSRSKGLSFEDNILDLSPYYVTDAKVYIECDDGTQWSAAGQDGGQYTIQTEKLNPERQYRLKIEFEDHEYVSEFSCPMVSPEIDSIFWMKQGEPVKIYVATHSPDSTVQYYRWTFQEDWEYTSFLRMYPDMNPFYPDGFPYFCWVKENNKGLLLGSSEKTVFGKINSQITEILPWDNRLSLLYRIEVKQNVIRKRAYDYFENAKKNAGKTGSLFAHVPSELKGNIMCTTDPARPVIGYVDVSSTTRKRLYISNHDIGDFYERPRLSETCAVITPFMFLTAYYFQLYGGKIPETFLIWLWEKPVSNPDPTPTGYVLNECVDCTLSGGTTQRPEDWPNDHFN